MASPTFVGISAVVQVLGSAAGPVAVSAPAGVVDDDIIFLVYVKANNASTAVLSAPGWGSEILSSANGQFDLGYGVYAMRASSAPTSWDIEETAFSSPLGAAFTVAYRGVPIDASPVYEDTGQYTSGSASASAFPFPDVDAVSADTTLIGFCVDFKTATITFTGNGSLTERLDHGATERSFALYDEAISGTGTITGRTATPSASSRPKTFSILLPGSAGGGGGGSSLPLKLQLLMGA